MALTNREWMALDAADRAFLSDGITTASNQKSAKMPVGICGGSVDMRPEDCASLEAELEQRQKMFAQLGTFINQMSQEAGSAEVWKKKLADLETQKLAELENMRERAAELEVAAADARSMATAADHARSAAEADRAAVHAELVQL